MQAKTGMRHDSIRSMHESIHQYWSHRDSCAGSAVWSAWRDAKSGKKSTAEEPMIRRNISVRNIAIVGVGIIVWITVVHTTQCMYWGRNLWAPAPVISLIYQNGLLLRYEYTYIHIEDRLRNSADPWYNRAYCTVRLLAVRSFAQEVDMHRQTWFQQLFSTILPANQQARYMYVVHWFLQKGRIAFTWTTELWEDATVNQSRQTVATMNSFLRDRVYLCFANTVASETCVSVDTMYAAMLAGTESISSFLLFPFFILK